MKRFTLAAAGFLLVFAAPAFAQDAVKADPDHYKVEFENDQVRVLRITYGPGEKSVMHWHPAGVAVMLHESKFRMWRADGSYEDNENTAGAVNWMEAVTHLPENLTDGSVEVILVEMKSATEEGCM